MHGQLKSCPSPFYDEDGITIYNGDFQKILPFIEAEVVVTDPPYGMGYRNTLDERIEGDRDTEIRDSMLEAWGDRPALVFGTWKAGRPRCRALLVWDKGASPGAGDCSLPWGLSHEEIYVRGHGWVKRSKRQTNVLRYPNQSAADARRPDHPTPKPVALMRHLLERCPLGTVLDPFMGSGSTLVAAKELGREAIGIELEQRYCEMAVDRLAQGTLDLGEGI